MAADKGGAAPAQIAKGALRRLAQGKLEPTPGNFARAYAEEAGTPAPGPDPRAQGLIERLAGRVTDDAALRQELVQGFAEGLGDGPWQRAERALEQLAARATPWASTIERLASGLERSSRQWTSARKKDSLKRVLDGSRMDANRMLQRLQGLLQAWEEGGEPDAGVETAADDGASREPAPSAAGSSSLSTQAVQAEPATCPGLWPRATSTLEQTVRAALPEDQSRAIELADALAGVAAEIERHGASAPLIETLGEVCERICRWLGHRQQLHQSLGALCSELGQSLLELAEDGSWARGQCEALQAELAVGVSSRGVKAASTLLRETRQRQRALRQERDAARDALKAFMHSLLAQVEELGAQTDRFEVSVGRHAEAIERADSLEGLAHVVSELLADSRSVQSLLRQTRAQLHDGHDQAQALADKVRELEGELRRLSQEVSTDTLTQIANRRGLAQSFEAECARLERQPDAKLAVGLLDIDNFKRLNDTLGHNAGDQALKALAAAVSERLRPADSVARLGGEEFVVLMPATERDEAQQVLTRLQRSLSASLFMHENKEIFVTFSAGVTLWRRGESLEAALQRADEALYEAKRTGKNRTCLA